MLDKTRVDEDIPLKFEDVNPEMTPVKQGETPKLRTSKIRFKVDEATSPQNDSLVSTCKSDRSNDAVNVDDLQVNPKTFMSFADPEQLM